MTSRAKAIVSLSGLFLLGAIIGALTVGIIVRGEVNEAQRLRNPEGFTEHFVEKLKLSEAQRDSLKDELERIYAEIAGLRRSTADEYRELLDSLTKRLSPQLTPEQRELLAREEQRFRRALPSEPLPPRKGPPTAMRQEQPPAPVAQSQPGVKGDTPTTHPEPKKEKPEGRVPPVADTSTAKAPTKPPVEDQAVEANINRLAERIKERCALDEGQAQQVDQIVRQTRERIQRARTELSDYPAMLRAAVRRNFREMNQRIQGVLREDQREPYQQIMRELLRSLRDQ